MPHSFAADFVQGSASACHDVGIDSHCDHCTNVELSHPAVYLGYLNQLREMSGLYQQSIAGFDYMCPT